MYLCCVFAFLFFFFFRTDCIFSPDDKMVITGVSMDKGDDCGKAVFFERDTFNRVYELPIEGAVSGGWEKMVSKTAVLC